MTPDEIAARMDGRITEAGPLRAEAFLPSPVVQNHASFLQWLPDGTLACAWFAGTLEGKPDICIRLATLSPGAAEWSQSDQVSDDPARSEQNPVLFPDPQGDGVWLFHTAQPGGGRQEECEVMLRPLETAPSGWRTGPCRSLGLPLGSFVRARVVVRDDGAWLLPLFLCKGLSGARWTGSHDTAAVAVSTDRGATWSLAEVPESTGCVHMTIVPLGGERMVAFFRRRQADFVYRTESSDGGRSWSTPEATDVPNNNSSIAVIRLADGRIALLCNPVSASQSAERRASLYDELGVDDDRADPTGGVEAIWGVPRAPLSLCLSEDEGRSFQTRRLVDDGPGTCLSNDPLDGRNKELSYPAMVQGSDGGLHLAYTYHRRAIKYVRLAPGWVDGR
jgi:predicted neuraminidase